VLQQEWFSGSKIGPPEGGPYVAGQLPGAGCQLSTSM